MKTILLLFVQFFFITSLFSEVKAIYNDDRVEISWSNPLHIKVDYFVIERSKTGKYFKEILKIDATENNGASIEYYEIDYKPFNTKAFYRIKQVDVDGIKYYSNMVMARSFNNVKPLFNLFSNSKNKELKGYKGTDILVVLIDANQQEFISRIDVMEEGKQLVTTYSLENLPTGEYLVTATSDDKIYGKKIIVNGSYIKPAYTQNIEQQ